MKTRLAQLELDVCEGDAGPDMIRVCFHRTKDEEIGSIVGLRELGDGLRVERLPDETEERLCDRFLLLWRTTTTGLGSTAVALTIYAEQPLVP